MKNHLVGYSYFGRSRGLQKINGGDLPIDFPVNDIVDLDPSVFEIERGQQLYRISRVDQVDSVLHFISLYEFAKEKSADRKGGFVGATIMLANCTAPATDIVFCLVEMLGSIKKLLSDEEQRFTVSELKNESISAPIHFAELKRKINDKRKYIVGSEKIFFQIDLNSRDSSVLSFIEDALDNEKLYKFEELYATSFHEILKKKDRVVVANYTSGYVSELDKIKHEVSKQRLLFSGLEQKLKDRENEILRDLEVLRQERTSLTNENKSLSKESTKYENSIISLKRDEENLKESIKELEKKQKLQREKASERKIKSTENTKQPDLSGRGAKNSQTVNSKELAKVKSDFEQLQTQWNELAEENKKLKFEGIALRTKVQGYEYRITQEKNAKDNTDKEGEKKNDKRSFSEWFRDKNRIIGILLIVFFFISILLAYFFLTSLKPVKIDAHSSDQKEISSLVQKYTKEHNNYNSEFVKIIRDRKDLLIKNPELNNDVKELISNYLHSGYSISEFASDTTIYVLRNEKQSELKLRIKKVLESCGTCRPFDKIDSFVDAIYGICDCCDNYFTDECTITIPLIKQMK